MNSVLTTHKGKKRRNNVEYWTMSLAKTQFSKIKIAFFKKSYRKTLIFNGEIAEN